MGQSCGCTEGPQQAERVKELEILLAHEKDEYSRIEESYSKLKSETDRLAQTRGRASKRVNQEIRTLEKEKKQHFNKMMALKSKMDKLDSEAGKLKGISSIYCA